MGSCKYRKVAALVSAGIALLLISCQPEPSKVVETNGRARATPEPTPVVKHVLIKPPPNPVKAAEPGSQQRERWDGAIVKASSIIAADRAVMLFLRTRWRYEAVSKMRSNGVPAPVIFAIHYRESDNSFKCHLHEGSSLQNRTRFVPKGRPLHPDPPYTWEVSAEDAIYVTDKLQGEWWSVTWGLNKIEGYNGWGYRKIGVPSPYLWAGTNRYEKGKYVSDGHYSGIAIDQQLGCAAILKRMKDKGIEISFIE